VNELERYFLRKQYSVATIKTYRRVLEDFLTFPDFDNLEDLEDVDLYAFIDRPGWEVGGTMRHCALSAVKEFLRYKFGEDHPAVSARVKRRKGKMQRTLTKDQLDRLLVYLDKGGVKGARDVAIVAVAVDTGMRASELARLQLEDVHLSEMWLQVVVKGGDWRPGFFSPDTANLLQRYLQLRSPVAGEGHCFLSTQKPKAGRGLSASGIQSMFKRASVDLDFKVSPHDLRRTYATVVTANGAPQRTAQLGGGWQSSEQFLGYVRALQAELIRPYLPMVGVLNVGS